MIFVSFVSKNTPYEKVVKDYLLPDLKKWNLNYEIDYIDNKGGWIDNVQYKPEFIKKMLLKYKCPIVSLDADATIEKNPVLFETLQDYDIGVHFLSWKMWYHKKEEKHELLGGTMYFNYNQKVLNLVDEWIKEQKSLKAYAQKVFQKVLPKHCDIKLYNLPVEYCFIECSKFPKIRKNAVIVHHQVSRKYRNNKW